MCLWIPVSTLLLNAHFKARKRLQFPTWIGVQKRPPQVRFDLPEMQVLEGGKPDLWGSFFAGQRKWKISRKGQSFLGSICRVIYLYNVALPVLRRHAPIRMKHHTFGCHFGSHICILQRLRRCLLCRESTRPECTRIWLVPGRTRGGPGCPFIQRSTYITRTITNICLGIHT